VARRFLTPQNTQRSEGADGEVDALGREGLSWWFAPQDDQGLPMPDLQAAGQLQAFAAATLQAVSAALAVSPLALVGGTTGADSLSGTAADDLLQGLGGNDTIDGAGGNDLVYGGEAGNDVGSGDDSITTAEGNDTLYGQDGNDSILAGEGDDFVDAGDGNDTVWGHAGIDTLYGGSGSDHLSAGLPIAGVLLVGGGLIDGGSGDDAISSREEDFVRVPYEPIVIKGNTVIGGDGNDQIEASGQDVRLYGDLVDPALPVTAGNDFIRSFGGGVDSRALILAGQGNDSVSSSNADFSTIDGGDGNDLLTVAWDGQSTLIGGSGDDTLSVTFFSGDFGNPFESRGLETTRLEGGSGNDSLLVDSNVDTSGGQTEITLLGGDDADSLTAQDNEADNNASRGMAHVTLDGGNGNDVLSVSGGLDVRLTGGAGRDTFVVTQAQYLTQTLGARVFENLGGTQTSVAAEPLRITDFQAGGSGDVLDLSSVLAGSAVGYLAGSNPFTSGHLSAQQVGADTHIVFDPDGLGAGAASPLALAVLQGVSVGGLVAANFLPSQYIAPNLPPSGTDAVLTLQEDQSRTLSAADFGFTDPNAGDALASVTLLSLPTRGQLQLNGADVTQGQVVAASSLAAGQLVFRPGADENNGGATLYAQLGFTVSDGSLSSTAHNLTFSVTAVNDAPVQSGAGVAPLATTLGQPLNFSSAVLLTGWQDVDVGDVIQAKPVSVSSGNLVNSGGSSWTFTPAAGFTGDVTLQYAVFDLQESAGIGSAIIRVAAAGNQPPTLVAAMPDQQAAQDWLFSAALPTNMFVDADSANFALSASLADGSALPSWLTFNAATRSFSGTPTVAPTSKAPTLLDIRVTATDTQGASTSDTFVLTVNWTRNINGSAGSDVLEGSIANETLNGGNSNDTIRGNGGTDQIYGGSGNDSLIGGSSADYLVGGTGADTMEGRQGNDRYAVDNLLDVVIETAGGGDDTVFATGINYELPFEVEHLNLAATSTAPSSILVGRGNNLFNRITGSTGADSIDGLGGDDTLTGAAGSDTLLGGEGKDRLFAYVANAKDPIANILDRLEGGLGDDLYEIDSANDLVIENPGEGLDTLRSWVTFTLGQNVEVLQLLGTIEALNGFGNGLDNGLTGNAGNNRLEGGDGNDTLTGGLGSDTLVGGSGNDRLFGLVANAQNPNDGDRMEGDAGDDLYQVDSTNDVVVENPDSGYDRVQCWNSYTLGANVEDLILLGTTGNTFLAGNELNNVLIGNSGINLLSGMGGADSMYGGGGSDSYDVNDVGDYVIELVGGGTGDVVYSRLTSYTLPDNVEGLSMLGISSRNGTGNSLANTLVGNEFNNRLDGGIGADSVYGLAGADWIAGGAGNDSLIGGTGGDTFVFDTTLNATPNVDRISDFNGTPDPVTGEQDHLWLDDAVFTAFTGLSSIAGSALLSGAGLTKASSVDHRLIYNTTTGALYYDPDGVGGTAETQFALLTNRAVLDSTDFLVG